ncbi:MAG: glycosyltransferase family 39 protein [Candidatus Margulisbacteria bacterium]|jgi:hypothetical protein|nr:glycosyltransferase family 39 protein [Candidatus Margulisiibacteriota bacterium]
MTIITLLLAALFFPVLTGLIVITFLTPDNDLQPLEALAVSYGAGFALISLLLFLMGLFFIPLTVLNILAAVALLLAYPFYICLTRRQIFARLVPAGLKGVFARLKWHDYLLILLITIRLLLVFYQAVVRPVEDIDSIAYRMMEAKIFYTEKSLSLNTHPGYFIGPSSRKNYPLNIPIFASWVYSALGTWDDAIVQIIFPAFLLAFAVAFYYLMRRLTSRSASLFSVYLLLSLPLLIYHAATSYIDAVVGFYYCTSFLYLLLFIRDRRPAHFIVSALLAGGAVWTKSEGLPLVISNLLVLSYFLVYLDNSAVRQKLFRLGQYAAAVLAFLLPWHAFQFIYRAQMPASGEVPVFSQIFNYYDRIPTIIEFYFRKALFYGNWNIAWFVFLVVLLVSVAARKLRREQWLVLFAIILALASFGSVYCLTDNWQSLLEGTVQNRNALTFTPLVVYFICFTVFKGENESGEQSVKPKKKNAYGRNKR